jgi:cytochrome P450
MRTIQITTTNIFYYMTKHPDYRAKLLKEIRPIVEKVKHNIVDELE